MLLRDQMEDIFDYCVDNTCLRDLESLSAGRFDNNVAARWATSAILRDAGGGAYSCAYIGQHIMHAPPRTVARWCREMDSAKVAPAGSRDRHARMLYTTLANGLLASDIIDHDTHDRLWKGDAQ